MSLGNIKTLPTYAYEDTVSVTVAVEGQLSYIFGGMYDRLATDLARTDNFSWFTFLSISSYEGDLGLSRKYTDSDINDYVKIRGNGDYFAISLITKQYEISATYNRTDGTVTISTAPYRQMVTIPHVIEYSQTMDFVSSLYTELTRVIINEIYLITSTIYSDNKYLPSFYYQTPDSLPVLTEHLITKTSDEIESYPMNSWSNMEVLRREFKLAEILDLDSPVLNIASPELLKGLFKIKGTEVGLHFLLKFYKADVTVLYKQDIIDAGMQNLAEDITDCDIVIDLSFGGDISIGVKKNKDGTAARDALGRIIFEDTDTKLKNWFHQIMQVCLNILAISYTKWIEEDYYKDNPPQDEVYTDEEIYLSTKYFFTIPPEYLCNEMFTALKYGLDDRKYNEPKLYYLPENYKSGQLVYNNSLVKTYNEGYRYSPTVDPIDFRIPYLSTCPWVAPSRVNYIDSSNVIIDGVCYDNSPLYNGGIFYDSSIKYSPIDTCNVNVSRYNNGVLYDSSINYVSKESYRKIKILSKFSYEEAYIFDEIIDVLDNTMSQQTESIESLLDTTSVLSVFLDNGQCGVSTNYSYNIIKYNDSKRFYNNGANYFSQKLINPSEDVLTLSTQIQYLDNFNVFIEEF